ncbi:helix-turn-helix domain-containing protein [Thalassotalea sp. PS06]|uniref:helix-turn-helix domain-containing protein n=1 Tax=Thalassotalea sp. PS06 TaxID=2594005 RepID=UPI001162546D|nr:AraC family transcriptional regulator [Thalassotalea sp. PS06]QDP02072.1 helix-turn-helix transcriptional regulator [Thalassotalea sp. PS06]
MLTGDQTGGITLVAFDNALAEVFQSKMSEYFQVNLIDTMQRLEEFNGSVSSFAYLMSHTTSDHLHNIQYLSERYSSIPIFVFSNSLSIPLLQHGLHCNVREMFLFPLTEQDMQVFLRELEVIGDVCVRKAKQPNLVPLANLQQSPAARYGAIAELLEEIEKNFSRGSSLQDFCHSIHLSQSRLSHLFKDVSGITFSHYLICRKLEEAERILSSQPMSSTSVAFELGFSNPSHFCRVFKEHFGLSPMAYSENNRTMRNSKMYLQYLRVRSSLFNELDNTGTGRISDAKHDKNSGNQGVSKTSR